MLKKCLLFILIIAVSARAENINPRVINGTAADGSQWPWIASISLLGSEPKQGHFCGGVLIDANHVLTAGHCVYDFLETPDQLQVTVGRSKLSSDAGITVASDGIIIHPQYVYENSLNDIAIIRVENTGLTNFAVPVSSDDIEFWGSGNSAKLLGWGYMDQYYPVRPDNLQQADIPVIDDQSCSDRIGIDFDPGSMLCAGKLAESAMSGDSIDACYGDSGGPLIVNTPQGYKVAGLVSWGFACGSEKYWGVYTRVANYYEWISSIPGVLPYVKEAPFIRGRPEINSTLKCNKGLWGGDSIDQFTYEWHDNNEGIIKSGIKAEYRLKASDIGRNIKCVVKASNKNGDTYSESLETGTIFPLTKKAKLTGAAKKNITAIGVTCDSRSCGLLLSVKENGIKQITAVFIPEDSRHIANGSLQNGTKVTSDSWRFKIKRLNFKNYKIYIRVIFENNTSKLLEMKLSL